jgi:PAS domain S-box-containing protein
LALFVGSTVVVTYLALGRLPGAHPLEYVVFPLMIAAAIAGGPPLTSVVVLVSSAVTIWNTIRGAGPFAGSEAHHNLVFVQTFTGVLGTTALLLSAAIAERRNLELRQRQSADTLRQRERLLRLAQRAGGVATFEWDFQNQVAKCSAEFFAIFGLPGRDGEMTGADWAQFVHPSDRDRMSAHLARALQGVEPAAADYRIIRADGAVRWLSYAGQVERMPEGVRMLGTVLDVTARVNAEAALRESRDVLSLAMRGGSMGAWSRDLATNEVWWSRELEEIVGFEEGAFARTEAAFLDIVHPDDRADVRRAVDQAVESRSDCVVEFRFQHAQGEWRWMEVRGRAVYGDDGTPRTLYGLGIDVTARKRAQAALLEAKNAAESANQVKDQFLATLSHELRTPLNAILGYARMLQTDSIAPEKRPRAIDIIARNAAAQNQLIEDLLDISRITRGQVRLELAPVAIAAVLREAVEGVRPAAEAKQMSVVVDIDPFAGMVSADATRMQQVFWNLLTNAVKFTGQGGSVTTTLRRVGNFVEVAVADTGAGIAPDFLPSVFEPFRQGDGSLARGHGGLGLGLAISRQLVELHGGTVTATSAGPGRGATFLVRLPAHADPGSFASSSGTTLGQFSPAALADGSPSLAGVDVLLVDDDEDTLALFRESLESAGAAVRAVTSAADALRANTDRPADLLVADLALPTMDGFELLRAIRATNPCIPAVAVTAYARLDDRARSLAAGFQAHVSKPIDPAAFVRTLIAAVSNAR